MCNLAMFVNNGTIYIRKIVIKQIKDVTLQRFN